MSFALFIMLLVPAFGARLSAYTVKHHLDGFVVEGKAYLLKSSKSYQEYLRMRKSSAADESIDNKSKA